MTHATPRQGKWFIDDDGYLCDEMGECIDLQTDAALIVQAVNTLELVRVIIPAIKQTIERVRCLEAGQAITTEADNLLADIQDNLNIVLTNMDGKQ